MSKKAKSLKMVLVLVVLMLGLAFGVILVQRNLEIREKAASPQNLK